MVDSSQDHSCDGNNGSLFTSSFGKTFTFVFVVGSGCGFNGGMGTLHQCRLEVNSGTCNSHRFLLTGRFIVAGRLEKLNCVISVPISEMMVMAEALSTPGMVQSRETAFS